MYIRQLIQTAGKMKAKTYYANYFLMIYTKVALKDRHGIKNEKLL